MVRRGMFHLPSPRKKTTNQSPRATKGAYANRNNPTVVPDPPFTYDDWKTRPWDEDSRGAGLISEDSVPPAPPGDNSINSNIDSAPQLDDVPGIVPRRNHGNTTLSPTSQASAAIPKGSVQKNPFLAKDNNDPLDENCQPHHGAPKNLKQATSTTQERAKRSSTTEAAQQQPPTPSRKGKKMFGRSKHAGDSPRAADQDKKGKKKGLLKNFFGGKKQSHNSKSTHSFSNAPTSPHDEASIAMDVESQASFVVQDVDEPSKPLSSVQKMKERFESSKATTNSASSRTSLADGGSKSKPLITTQKSEADPNAFASSLLELDTVEPPKEPAAAPSEDEDQPDCDETTVSCLTNPTYFQSDSRAWPSMLDDMSCKSPPKVNRKKPAVEQERPKSPDMGDFFTQKESLDSWEKSDGFSDPFFNAKTSDSFPPPDDDDDETAIFGSASASAFQGSPSFGNAFEDEMKTDDFKVLKKQESPKRVVQESPRRRRLQRMPSQNRKILNKAPETQAETKPKTTPVPTTTPVRPPRLPLASPPVSTSNTPARPASPSASVASSVCGSVERSRRSLRSMSPSARRRMRRSPSPVSVKPLPPTTKVVVPEPKPVPNAAPPSEQESHEKDSKSKLDRRKKWAQKRVASFSNRSVQSQVSAASSKTKAKEAEPPLPKSISTKSVDVTIDQKAAATKTKTSSSLATTNLRTAASPARSKFSSRYKKKQNTHLEENEQKKKTTKPSLSLNTKEAVTESTIYVVATSPTKKSSQKKGFDGGTKTKPVPAPASAKDEAASQIIAASSSNDNSYKPSAYAGRFSSRAKQALSRKAASGKALEKALPVAELAPFAPPRPVKDHHHTGKVPTNSHQLRILSSSDASSVASTITSSTGRHISEAKPIPAVFHGGNATEQAPQDGNETLQVTCSTSRPYEPRPLDDASLTNTIFSVGKKQVPSQRLSELRVLLHRPRVHNRGRTPKHSGPMKTVFPCYDESKVTDPMARAGLRLLSASVIPIQAATRRFLAGRNLMTQWWAALVIQSRYRAFLQERDFKAKKNAAIEIQRIARSMIVWQRLCLEDFCAIEIQRCVRGYLVSMKCYQAIANITLLQNLWRKRQAHKEVKLRMKSIVLLQGWLRGNMVRREVALQQAAATEIQRAARGHMASVKYCIQIYSTTLIQAHWRRRRALQAAFARMTRVLAIQAWTRGNLLRRHVALQHASATEIQRHVRGHLATLKVYEAIYYVTLLQKLVRQKQAVALATERMRAIFALQAAARGHLARRNLQRLNSMAVTIQRRIRGYLAVLFVYEEIYKVMLVQNLVRRRRAIQLAAKRKTAIIRIQSQYRKFRVRNWLKRQHDAATQVQRFTRGYLATLKVYEDIYRITIAQNCWRRRKAMQLATKRKEHAVHLESVVRGYLARKKYQIKREKATIIQTIWRSFFLRMLYHFKIMDIIVLQSLWRRKSAVAFVTRKRHDLHTRSTTAIQARWRCYTLRARYLHHQLQVRSAIIIQSQWRAFCATMDYYEYLANLITVQSVSRRWLAQRDVLSYKTEYSLRLQRVARGFLGRLKASTRMYLVISIQSLARTFLQRRRYKQLLFQHRSNAAIAIQRSWRGFACAADYLVTRADIIVAQSISRRWSATRKVNCLRRERDFQRKTKAATLIQSSWRCYDATIRYLLYLSNIMMVQSIIRRWAAKRYVESYKTKYALRLQSTVRGFLARTEFETKIYCIVTIQSSIRSHMQQKVYKKQLFTHKTNAAIRIQKTWRGFACMANYVFTMADIVVAQSVARKWFAMKEANKLRQERDSILTIQSFFRCLAAKKYVDAYKTKYAMRLQSAARGFLARSEFETKMYVILTLQSLVRMQQQQKQYRKQLLVYKTNAVILIQKTWRGFACVADYIFTMADIVIAQAVARKWLAMKEANKLRQERNSILTIQSFFRCLAAKRYVQAYKEKYALRLQSAVRGFLARTDFETKLYVILTLQSLVRARLQQKLYKTQLFAHKTNAAILIQKTWRGFACVADYIFTMADIVIAQSVARKWLAVKQTKKLRQTLAATKIQSQWRCYDATISYLLTLSSITKAQSVVRHWLAVRYVHAYKEKYALRLQSAARGFLARSNARKRLYLVVSLQSLFRGFIQRRLFRKELYERKEQAAITIQKRWRGFLCTTDFMIAVADIVIVQTLARRWFALKEAERLREERRYAAANTICLYWRGYCEKSAFQIVLMNHRAARSIQSAWRMYDAWSSFKIQLHHIMRIQAGIRGFIERCRFAKTVWSSILIQAAVRGFLARGQANCKRLGLVQYQISQDFSWRVSHAAVLIQSSLRRHMAHSSFLRFMSARKIQSMFRCHSAVKAYQDQRRKINENNAACRIQSLRKMREARLTLDGLRRQFNAVTKIQATWRGFMVYTDYLFTLCDIMKIQSASRGFLARRRYLRMREEIHHASAKCIQSMWRGYSSRTDYLLTVMDVVTIQNLVRRWLAQKEYQVRIESYHKKRLLGALKIQQQWRAKCARDLLKKHLLVRRLQCAVRVYIASSRLQEHLAARTIQATWRGFIHFTNHLFVIGDIVKVQSVVRRWKARREYHTRKEAWIKESATRLQAAWRCHSVRTKFLQDRLSIITFQCFVRCRLAKKVFREQLEQELDRRNDAAATVQLAWRCKRDRGYLQSIYSARRIQCAWRSHKARGVLMSLITECVAATMIQSAWRGYWAFEKYILSLVDIIKIQALARGKSAQRQLKLLKAEKEENSAIILQAAWRSYLCSTSFLHARRDVVIVQSIARRLIAKRYRDDLTFERKNKSAISIQSAWRGYISFKGYVLVLSEIITVQSIGRRLLAKRQYNELLREKNILCAILIQKSWRGFASLKEYLCTLSDVITVQSIARQLLAKRCLKALLQERSHKNAITIQKAWRGFSVYAKFCVVLCDVITIQSCARRVIAKRKAMSLKWKRDNNCATSIQTVWRRYSAVNDAQKDKLRILTLQSFARMIFGQRLLRKLKFEKKMYAALLLQSAWRKHFCMTSYAFVRSDVILAQCQVRQYIARKEVAMRSKLRMMECATMIQKQWRMHFCRTSYLYILCDIIIAQSQVRVFLAQRDFKERMNNLKNKCATTLQKQWRMHFCKTSYHYVLSDIITAQSQVRVFFAKQVFSERVKNHQISSAIKIQKVWRSFYCFSSYLLVLSDVIKAQAQVRMYLAKRDFARRLFLLQNQSAIALQNIWKAYLHRTSYEMARQDIIRVQCQVRGRLAKTELSRRFHRRREASAISIQKIWRGYVASTFVSSYKAATKIQKVWRGYLVFAMYTILYADIIKVQSLARRRLARTVCDSKRAQRRNDAAVSIQKIFRANVARTDLNLMRFSALTIQRCWRGHRGRLNLFVAWKAHVDHINAAATKIQSKWRAYDRQQIHLYTVGSVIQIQSICRMSMAKARYAHTRNAAILIQTHQRRFSCRMEILNQIAKLLCKKVKHHQFGDSALKIQCAWRRSKIQERVFCRTQLILGLRNRSAESITAFMRMATSKLLVSRLRLARKRNNAATTLQLWYRVARRVRAKRRLRAGRTIYKFLRFVKAEVDREIRAQEKRMKFRQKMKHRTKEFDEAMLENAWEKIELNVEEPKRRRKDRPNRSNSITSEFSLDDRSQRSCNPTERSSRMSRHDAMNRSTGDDHVVDVRATLDTYSRSIPRRDNPSLPPMARSGHEYYNYPPSHYEMPVPAYRLPPPRMKTFSRDQIDQDLSLEEAYLDVEISGAKERRMTDKLMKQQQRRSRSSSRTRSSGSSVKSFRSTRSGVVPSSRNSSSGARCSSSGDRASSTSRASSSSRATMRSNDDRRLPRAASTSRPSHRSSNSVRSSSGDRRSHSRAFDRDCSSVVSSQDRRRSSHRTERDCSSVVSRSRPHFGMDERRRPRSPAP